MDYSKLREIKKEIFMKKALLLLGIFATMLVAAQTSFAACPCACPAAPCDPCLATPPCATACPAPCVVSPACPAPCCDNCNTCCNNGKCKCTWWKIFENKCCCNKCNPNCKCGCSAKRCYWWKFWEDRCCVQNGTNCNPCCDKCNSCGCCGD